MSKPFVNADKSDRISLGGISRSLFRFTLSTILLMSFTFIVISSLVIKSTLSELYERFAEREAASLQSGLNQIIEAKLSVLADHASLPFIVNSAMHPEETDLNVKDYLENLRILNNRVDLILLDINGEVIYSTAETSELPWRSEKWVSEIVDFGLPNYVSVYNDNTISFMRMAVPIMYNNYVEGVLVGVTPSMFGGVFDELVEEQGMYATVVSHGRRVHSSGVERDESSFVKKIDMPSINGTLELVVYKTAIAQGLTKLFIFGASAGLLACIIFVLVFRRLGIKLVIEPQRLLEKSRLQTMIVNKKLGAANEELAQFSYRASHDLKAPLVSARGLAELVGEDIRDGDYDEAVINSKKIGTQLSRLERLVTDILDLAKADLQDSVKQQFNLAELLNEINERLEFLYSDNDVRIDVQVPPETEIYASRSRVSQVLENLISNGVKYSNPAQEDRFVQIQVSKTELATEIVVRDNGLGIPAEFQSQVFDMFKRFHPCVSFGSGLGMYIIKKHIDNMNARLTFESSPEGSVFCVSLLTAARN